MEKRPFLIDTHCHADAYFSLGEVISDVEKSRVHVIAVTNTPAAFQRMSLRIGRSELMRVAVGIHPLEAHSAGNSVLMAFELALGITDYVGEIGLDFSPQGTATRTAQLGVFERICDALKRRPRVATVHTRGAAKHALRSLRESGVGPVVLHWFVSIKDLDDALADGHYFSFNSSMCNSAKGRDMLLRIPSDRILTETDGPYAKTLGRVSYPSDIPSICKSIAKSWNCDPSNAEAKVASNFARLKKLFAVAADS